MPVVRIQVGFVSGLQTDEVVSEDLLPLFDDFQAEVGGIVEWHAEVPSDIDQIRYVAEHVKQIWGEYQRRCLSLQKKKGGD